MSWTSERARVASLSRDRKPDDPDLIAARVALREARLEDYVARVVAEAPPLSPEVRDRLAALLRPGVTASGGTTSADTSIRRDHERRHQGKAALA